MEIIFTKVFNMSVAASMLILAVILLRLILKSSPKWIRCVLWLLVALRLVIPLSFESPLSLIPNAQAMNSTTQSSTSYVSSLVNSDSFQTMQNAVSSNNEIKIITILSYIWIVGVGAMLIYMLFSYLHLHLKVRESIVIKGNILICDRISSPFVFGIIRPRIYLPSKLSETEKSYVIAHEQAHIKHHDYLWKPLGYLILSVHFFNPLCWIAFKLFTNDIELACDERVIKNYDIQDKKGYSTALLSCSIERNILSACPFSFGESGLKQRIKSVLGYKKPTVRIVILSFAVCLLTAMSFMTNPITSALEIHSDNSESAIDNIKKVSFDFAEPTTTAPVTEPPTKPTEPQKAEEREESKPQDTVAENEPSEDIVDDSETADNYDSYYSDESYSNDSNSYDPVAENLVPITPFDNESTQKYNDQVSDAYREVNEQIEYYERVNYQPEPSAEEKPFQSLPDLKWD
ncbi:M56 family metallopeptidase [uncultured Ruminococcus sp.]|jgi:beta-lactamase regulating signal transducer with metallopeptidase domain|uniref:M56 family metallopeptidase n=1 Tax=uncultured Ruminococcus sp. TaxID=165186 RepID=UPI0025F9B523|nr:M56 family metallopeptidase [uncultured Ruminococcus sp.]